MAGGKIDILVSPDVKKFPDEMESGLKGALGTAGKIGSAIGLALGGAATIKSVASLGLAFDEQMNTMSAVSQATAPQLAAVEQRARDLGKSADLTATSASDAAAAMTELVKGGFSVEQSMDAAKGTLQLASAAQIEAADAATIQSQALQAFGLDASYAATASDILAGAANASSAEIEGIANGLSQSGAVANQFGVSLEDNATALAMFANAGIQGSDAGTLLKSALLSMTKDSKPARAAIEELGLEVYDAQGKFVGLEALFTQLETASKSMTEEQYQAASAALFGSDAMRLAGVAAEQGAEGWRSTYDAVTRAGQASEVAAAQAQGLPGVLEAIENQAEDTGIAVYDAFAGLALGGGQSLVGLIESAAPKIEAGARAIAGGIEAALPTVERVVGVVSTGVGEISGSLSVLGGAGLSTLRAVGDVLLPAGEGALSLTENLGGLTGPLMVAGTALAVGKWKGWGDAVSTGASNLATKRQRISDMIPVYQRLAEAEGYSVSKMQAGVAIMERQYPVIGRMGDAYRTNGVHLRSWGQQAQLSGIQVGGLGGLMGQATGTAARLGGTLSGALASGASLAGDGVRGLVSALGGGWNVAIAGAALAIAGITSEIDKTRKSADLMRDLGQASEEMGDQLFTAMTKGDLSGELSAVSTGIEGLLQNLQQLENTAPGAMSVFTGAWGDISGWFKGEGLNSGTNARAAQQEVAESAKLITDALEQAGITAQEAGTAVSGSATQYNALIDSLDLTTEGGKAAADALAEQRAEFLRMEGLVDSLAPGAVVLSEAMAKIGDEAASSEERVSALSTALDTMLGIDMTADEALANLHEGIDKVAESAEQALDQTKGFGENLFGGNGAGGLDYAQTNALTLRDTLYGMRDDLNKVADAGEDVGAAFELQQPVLDSLAEKYGISGDRVRELASDMGLVPTLIETTVKVSNHEALTGLKEVWGQIQANEVEAGKPLTVTVENVAESQEKLEDLGWSVRVLHEDEEGRGAIQVTADTQQAIDEVDTLVSAIASIDPEKGIAFHSNSPEQIEQIRELGIEVEDLGDGEYKISSNTPAEIELLVELGVLVKDKKTGEVEINSNLDEVLAKGKELDRRNGRKTRETHEVVKLERTIRSTEYANTAGGTQSLPMSMQADGSVRAAADGLLSQQDAQIARGGSWLMWAEDETKGESFIPHAPEKRGRSTQILAETARIFGLGVVDAAGNPVTRNGASVAQRNPTYFADGAVRTASEILAFAKGETVAGQQASRSLEGAQYVFGGSNWGDCSSTQGQLALFAVGREATRGRYMATSNADQQLAALGFRPGVGGSGTFSIGFLNGGPGGGHTSGTVDGVNVEMGGARGNGQIGGGAAPASHPQYTHHRHIPLPGASLALGSDGGEITSTSVDGYSYTSRGVNERHVDWGEAAALHEMARRHLGVYDTGGVLPAGGVAINRSSMDEVIVNGPDLRAINNLSTNVGTLVQQLRSGNTAGAQAQVQVISADLIHGMTDAMESAEAQVVSFGRTLGGDFLGKTQIVQDAERALVETRMGLAEESAALTAQEREVARARQSLSKVSAQGGELSTSMARRVSDAEQDLAKARGEGKADKIADAEKKLSRIREDAAADLEKSEEQSAKATLAAMEDVQQAEKDLSEMRNLQETAARRLEAAERAVSAARYQAIADLAGQAGGALAAVATGMSDFFGTLAEQAQIMEETRQRLIAEQIERQAADLAAQRARLDLVIAEQDIARVRAYGAISVADAEANLQRARELAALKGQTGIDAMSDALDRARETGIFAVEDVAGSVIENSEEVRAAQHAVEAARAQALKDELDATYRQRMAVLDLASATLTQQKAIALVDISTRQLADQAAQLGGLTAQGAQRASGGWGGLAQAGGGLGKLVGGLAKGAAGFAAGGPIGALLGGGMDVVGGIFDIFTGGRKAIKNKDEIAQSWNGMDLGDKIVTGGGLLLGTGVAAGGAALSGQYGGELGGIAAQLGAEIAAQSAGYAQNAITSDLERINSLSEEERAKLQHEYDLEAARIAKAKAETEMDYLQQSTILASNVEIAELLGKIAQADTTDQADALADAAIIAAERRDQMIDILARQLDIADAQKNQPRQSLTVQLPADGWIPVATVETLIDTMGRIQTEVDIKKETIAGVDYLTART